MPAAETATYTFSGHETFSCRPFWLKKGYDYVLAERKFSAPDAVVHLGVGKNMVKSIHFWMKAFGLLNGDQLTEIAHRVFADDGWDPYLEDEGTLWLLHYLLHSTDYASTFPIILNDLRKKKPEFTSRHFAMHVENNIGDSSARVLRDAFSVFVRTYVHDRTKGVEDGYNGLLADLDFLVEAKRDGERAYSVRMDTHSQIPSEIILYAVMMNTDFGKSISFDQLYLDANSIGTIFALDRDGLSEHLKMLSNHYPQYVYYNDDPLIRELQIRDEKLSPVDAIKHYYEG